MLLWEAAGLESLTFQFNVFKLRQAERQVPVDSLKLPQRRPTPAMRFPTILIVSTLLSLVYASSGDRSSIYVRCVDSCNLEHCGALQSSLSFALRLTRWSCTDNCKYQCMHAITERDVEQGRSVQQYYGKWPFWRFAGMQEPASVASSLLNLWAHARGASKLRSKISETHPMRSYYLTWSLVSINAWIWSSVFHTRGTFSPTEWAYSYLCNRCTNNGKVGLFFGSPCNHVRFVLHHHPSLSPLRPAPRSISSKCETITTSKAQATRCSLYFALHRTRLVSLSSP